MSCPPETNHYCLITALVAYLVPVYGWMFVGGLLHWSQTATETSASLSVEISSYVLLAKLSASPTAEDLGYAARIVRWLTGQQNQYGGFSSTQVRPKQLELRQSSCTVDNFTVIVF